MGTIRKRHSAESKFKIALEATKEIKTLNELSSLHCVHATQISLWKKQLIEEGAEIFGKKDHVSKSSDKIITTLYEQVGKLTMELDWLKKKLTT